MPILYCKTWGTRTLFMHPPALHVPYRMTNSNESILVDNNGCDVSYAVLVNNIILANHRPAGCFKFTSGFQREPHLACRILNDREQRTYTCFITLVNKGKYSSCPRRLNLLFYGRVSILPSIHQICIPIWGRTKVGLVNECFKIASFISRES